MPEFNLTAIRRRINGYFDVEVTHVVHLSCFFARRLLVQFEVVDELQECLNDPSLVQKLRPMQRTEIKPGVFVLVPSKFEPTHRLRREEVHDMSTVHEEYHRAEVCSQSVRVGPSGERDRYVLVRYVLPVCLLFVCL